MLMNHRFLLTLALAATLLFSAALAAGRYAYHADRRADSAIFEQVLENIHTRGAAVSNVFAATQNFIDREYFIHDLPTLLSMKLSAPDEVERDMSRFHAYGILFAMEPMLNFLDSWMLLYGLQALTYSGVVLAAFSMVLRPTGRPLLAMLFALCVACHPVVLGGLHGQFYPDRLYVLAGLLLLHLVWTHAPWWTVMVVAILVATINERAALIGGLSLLVLPWCRGQWKEGLRRKACMAMLGILLLAYSSLISRLWLSNMYYGTYLPQTWAKATERILDPVYQHNLGVFIAVNLVMLVMAWPNRRLMGFALLMIGPNMVGSVGGAEKVGWVSHYHSYYFPALMFAAMHGVIAKHRSAWLPHALTAAICVTVWLSCAEVAQRRLPDLKYAQQQFLSLRQWIKGQPTGLTSRDEVRSLVPPNSLVSTDEQGMAWLKSHARVDFFPVAPAQADQLLLPCAWVETANQDEQSKPPVSMQWLASEGFDFTPRQLVSAPGYCLFGRTVPR